MLIAVFLNADSETPTWRRIKCCRQSRDVPTGNCLFFPIFGDFYREAESWDLRNGLQGDSSKSFVFFWGSG